MADYKIRSIDGCDRVAVSRNLCAKHYHKARRRGELEGIRTNRKYGQTDCECCERPGCDQKPIQKGLCSKHYQYWRRTRTDSRRCKIDGCNGAVVARNMCHNHYQNARNRGELEDIKTRGKSQTDCEYPGCDQKHNARGLCSKHYQQWRRYQQGDKR